MRILIIGTLQWEMYTPALANGFKALCHDVETIDERDCFVHNSVFNKIVNKIVSKYHVGGRIASYNKEIINKVKDFRPELVFLYSCYSVFPSTVKRIKELGVIVFNYNNDDPFSKALNTWGYRYFHSIIPLAHVNLVYRKKNFADYKRVGAKRIELLLPYYIEKNNYYDSSVSDSEPIAFVGHYENDGRDLFIKALLDAGLPVKVYGGDLWRKAPYYNQIKMIIKKGMRGPDYNKKLNECKIALVFLSKLNNDTYTRRCFEIPATKTLMMCEYTDDMNELFPSDECAVYFHTKEELVEKCKALLNNPSEIERIAQNGFERLKVIGGSEIDRCHQIVELYNNYKA